MWMILRAGPYTCGEWDFGGLPGWLLKHPGLHIRQNEPQFMAYCKKYIEEVGKQVADMQVGHGGPIIMTQVENELHRIDDYLRALQGDFIAAGFDGQLMTCDPSGQPWTTLEGHADCAGRDTPSIRRTAGNALLHTQSTWLVNKVRRDIPIFSPEVYIRGGLRSRLGIGDLRSRRRWMCRRRWQNDSVFVGSRMTSARPDFVVKPVRVQWGTNFWFTSGQ